EQAGTVPTRQLEQVKRAFAVDAQGLDRKTRKARRARRAWKMVDAIDVRQRGKLAHDIMLYEREQGIVEPSADVLDQTGREIVHTDDAVLFHDQLFAQVRTDHPCSAGNENF